MNHASAMNRVPRVWIQGHAEKADRGKNSQNAVRPIMTSYNIHPSASRFQTSHSTRSQLRRAMTLTVTGTISSTTVTLQHFSNLFPLGDSVKDK